MVDIVDGKMDLMDSNGLSPWASILLQPLYVFDVPVPHSFGFLYASRALPHHSMGPWLSRAPKAL